MFYSPPSPPFHHSVPRPASHIEHTPKITILSRARCWQQFYRSICRANQTHNSVIVYSLYYEVWTHQIAKRMKKKKTCRKRDCLSLVVRQANFSSSVLAHNNVVFDNRRTRRTSARSLYMLIIECCPRAGLSISTPATRRTTYIFIYDPMFGTFSDW